MGKTLQALEKLEQRGNTGASAPVAKLESALAMPTEMAKYTKSIDIYMKEIKS